MLLVAFTKYTTAAEAAAAAAMMVAVVAERGGGTRKESDERPACPDGSDFIALEFLLTERLDKNN